jgi:molybdopterin-biosynthesis enzyme MoeA-like protein
MDDGFGLVVIGDEILAGRRRDRHFEGIGGLLRERGYRLAWLRIVPDDPDYLVEEFRRTMGEGIPVFSCGGIGATPDDHTRACAAQAAGVPLVRHAGAVAEIEARFGEQAYPERVRMADLPEGAELIPNPYNRVPGFSLRRHYFLPGFPDMAHPMARWVLENHYPVITPEVQRSVWVQAVTETVLMELLEDLTRRFPEHKLFSLPRLGKVRRVELGYRGREAIDVPFAALLQGLQERGFEFEIEDESREANTKRR